MKAILAAILFFSLVGTGRAQLPGPPTEDNSTNRLTVWLDLRWNTNHAVFHAPARIDLLAYVGLRPRPRAGDVAQVEFFADAQRLGSSKAIWHDEIRPPSGQLYLLGPPPAIPMHILAAQFYPAEWVWKKAPAGSYTFTARATWANSLTAVSKPVSVTVLP